MADREEVGLEGDPTVVRLGTRMGGDSWDECVGESGWRVTPLYFACSVNMHGKV